MSDRPTREYTVTERRTGAIGFGLFMAMILGGGRPLTRLCLDGVFSWRLLGRDLGVALASGVFGGLLMYFSGPTRRPPQGPDGSSSD